MKLSKMLGYVPYVVDFNVDDLNMEQLPGEPQKINELWFYKADSNKESNYKSGEFKFATIGVDY